MAMPNVDQALLDFMTENDYDGVFLMGFKKSVHPVVKDFGIIARVDEHLTDKIVEILRSKQELIEIWELKSHKFGGRFFDQASKGSRKVILPIVQESVNKVVIE